MIKEISFELINNDYGAAFRPSVGQSIDSHLLSDTSKDQHSSLFLAAQEGNLETVKYLISRKVDIEEGSADGATPLYIAAEWGHESLVKYLRNAIRKMAG